MKFTAKVRTCFWFNGDGHEAAEFYVSLLPDSFIENVLLPKYGEPPLVVEFTLVGAPMMALNGGSQFTPSGGVSFHSDRRPERDRPDLVCIDQQWWVAEYVWLAGGQVWRVLADCTRSVAAQVGLR